MLRVYLVEDNQRLQQALHRGLEATGKVLVIAACERGEDAIHLMQDDEPGTVFLMDVALAGVQNGIEAAVAIRREYPRQPVVFYSIQDDDAYFRAFLAAGILSHYAYVRKSNFLLPEMIVPLLQDAVDGRSYIDPEIEARVHEVHHKDRNDPMALLEPNEQTVAQLLAQGLTNEEIAGQLGFRDKRTISRTNGQIYAAWGLVANATSEKVARTRAALIVQAGRLIQWDKTGAPMVQNERGDWIPWDGVA